MKKLLILMAAALGSLRAEVYVVKNYHPGLIRIAAQAVGEVVTTVVGGSTTTVIESDRPVVARPIYQPVIVAYPDYNPHYVGNPYYYGYGYHWGYPGGRPRRDHHHTHRH